MTLLSTNLIRNITQLKSSCQIDLITIHDFLLTRLKIPSKTAAPMTATTKLLRLNPVTPAAPNKLMINPPSQLPMIPTITFAIIPILPFLFVNILATQPANPPKIIQMNQFIVITFPSHARLNESKQSICFQRLPIDYNKDTANCHSCSDTLR